MCADPLGPATPVRIRAVRTDKEVGLLLLKCGDHLAQTIARLEIALAQEDEDDSTLVNVPGASSIPGEDCTLASN